MLRLLPGWAQACRKTDRKRGRKSPREFENRWRKAVFEQLEDRFVLAGGLIPIGVQNALSTNLSNTINNSLAPTASLPPNCVLKA